MDAAAKLERWGLCDSRLAPQLGRKETSTGSSWFAIHECKEVDVGRYASGVVEMQGRCRSKVMPSNRKRNRLECE